MTTTPPRPRYRIAIDEEGYPHFDGLRVQDDELLARLLGSLRRRTPGDLSSLLVAECEGELCWVEAFDAPLVAQSVDHVTDTGAEWVFPGGVKHTVAHADLEVDEWNRLHAWIGADAIPALLSRKAQAMLLHATSLEKKESPAKFRERVVTPVSQASFWSQVYQENRDGWELGTPTPVLTNEFARVAAELPKGSRVCVPGAGRGHDAAYLADQGYDVTALDIAPEAERDFRARYPRSPVKYLREDIFAHLKATPGAYAAVFEHTIFCAIEPSRRTEYIQAVHTSLKAGGFYFGVFFVRTAPGGPPFGLTQWELREHTQNLFKIRDWHVSDHSVSPRWGQELWAVLVKSS